MGVGHGNLQLNLVQETILTNLRMVIMIIGMDLVGKAITDLLKAVVQ